MTSHEKLKREMKFKNEIWHLKTTEANLLRALKFTKDLKILLQIEESQLKWKYANELPKIKEPKEENFT